MQFSRKQSFNFSFFKNLFVYNVSFCKFWVLLLSCIFFSPVEQFLRHWLNRVLGHVEVERTKEMGWLYFEEMETIWKAKGNHKGGI